MNGKPWVRTVVIGRLVCANAVSAQATTTGHQHTAGMPHPNDSTRLVTSSPRQAGQAAFGALAELVRILDTDPTVDWTRVNIERVRQHLIDMDNVVLSASVEQSNIAGGAVFVVRGGGRVVGSIQRMSRAHANMLQRESTYRVTVERLTNGARVTVLAADARDHAAVARIRGLGFIGLLTTGDHHGPHHLQMARGDMMHDHEP